MKMNMSASERILRLLFAIMVAILYLTKMLSGTIAVVLGIVAVIFLITAIIGFCPLYAIFKYSSRKKKEII